MGLREGWEGTVMRTNSAFASSAAVAAAVAVVVVLGGGL